MKTAGDDVRRFLGKLDRVWQVAVIDSEEAEIDQAWETYETVSEVMSNLLVITALVLLAYYDSRAKELKNGHKSTLLEKHIQQLLSAPNSSVIMDVNHALSIIEWALPCQGIPFLHPDCLKGRHVMALDALNRGPSDVHFYDHKRIAVRASQVPYDQLVADFLRSIEFMTRVHPVANHLTAADILLPASRGGAYQFRLTPFFCHHESQLLPFWRLDSKEDKYVYRRLYDSQEEKRARPPERGARPASQQVQRLVTPLLSSSFRSLAELTRIASRYLEQHSAVLHKILGARREKTGKSGVDVRSFIKGPEMATWKLVTELGPIGFLEMDEALAEHVFREVHNGDDETTIAELAATSRETGIPFNRLLAVEAARLLQLEIHESAATFGLDHLIRRTERDLSTVEDASKDALQTLVARVLEWDDTIERELKFLILFYGTLARLADGRFSVSAEDLRVLLQSDRYQASEPQERLSALWERLRQIAVDPLHRTALSTITKREGVFEGLELFDMGRLLGHRHAIAVSTGRDFDSVRHSLRKYLLEARSLFDYLRNSGDPVRPIHPHVLQFRAAMFTSGGLTTMQYASDFGGPETRVVVYTARPIALARAYYCLPRLDDSDLSGREKILVNPFLVPADEVDRYFQGTTQA